MNISYRKVENKDINLVLDIDRIASCGSYYHPLRTIKEAEKFLKDNRWFLVYQENKPLASFSYKIEGKNSAQITGLAILSQYQRKGIGSQILKKILEDLKKMKKVWLVTHPRNIASLKLYLNFGFFIEGWKDNYFGNGEPRLILQKINY